MSDILALINNMRDSETRYVFGPAAADALEEQARRIAHLEEMFNGWRDEARKADARIAELEAEAAAYTAAKALQGYGVDTHSMLVAAVKKSSKLAIEYHNETVVLRARIAELEAALKPFADDAQYHKNRNAIFTIDYDDRITVADLRAARAALTQKEN